MTAVLWASGVVQGVGLAKTLRGRSAALSRELADLELLAEPRWRVSRRRWRPKSVCRRRSSPSPLRGALQIDCAKGTKQLRGRGNRCGISALGSGGCAAGQMLRAPKTHHDILYRMLGTRQNSPRPLRGALRRAGGARNVPRNRAGKCRDAAGARTVCAAAGARWEEERLLPAPCVVESGASEDKCAKLTLCNN